MWDEWKHIFLVVADRHAPPITKKVKSECAPWITSEIKNMMHRRDFLKRNAAKEDFFEFFLLKIASHIVVCGDFNIVVNPEVDHQGCNPSSSWAYNWPASLQMLTHHLDLVNIRRVMYPSSIEFILHRVVILMLLVWICFESHSILPLVFLMSLSIPFFDLITHMSISEFLFLLCLTVGQVCGS